MGAADPTNVLATTTGMCRACRRLAPARIVERGGSVFQVNDCPACGPSEALLAESVDWYRRGQRHAIRSRSWRIAGRPRERGCPFDCGPCAEHAGACNLPVFSITNACDMRCPICFTYNRTDRLYRMTRDELARLLDRLLERVGTVDLVNLTGGEPTLHPELLELIAEAGRPAIGRVTVNSNGLRLSRDPALCAGLARAGAYVILSFDTLRSDVAVRIHGRDVVETKRTALRNLEAAGVGTTLLHVLIPGANETEFGDVLDLALAHGNVRNITVQTMTYTGLGGGGFLPRQHLPLDRAARWIEESTRGRIRRSSFRPLPAAHPLCYQVAYFFRWRGVLYDLFEILDPAGVDDLFEGGYLLCPGDRAQQAFRAGLDRLWAEGREPELLEGFKSLVRDLHPGGGDVPSVAEGQRVGEKYFFAVYLHAHMDEDNLDLARLRSCPDQVPDPEGRLVPACAYNLFYRMKDPRFWVEDAERSAP